VHNPAPRKDGHSTNEFSVTADEVTCQQFVELITEYFEGALTPRTLSLVEEHLVMCDWCTTYLEQMQLTIASLRDLHEPASAEPPAALVAALHAHRSAGR
jgi:predicted anti-sigma-YlaC factor YlaD